MALELLANWWQPADVEGWRGIKKPVHYRKDFSMFGHSPPPHPLRVPCCPAQLIDSGPVPTHSLSLSLAL